MGRKQFSNLYELTFETYPNNTKSHIRIFYGSLMPKAILKIHANTYYANRIENQYKTKILALNLIKHSIKIEGV